LVTFNRSRQFNYLPGENAVDSARIIEMMDLLCAGIPTGSGNGSEKFFSLNAMVIIFTTKNGSNLQTAEYSSGVRGVYARRVGQDLRTGNLSIPGDTPAPGLGKSGYTW
jgi:hypothetical protein